MRVNKQVVKGVEQWPKAYINKQPIRARLIIQNSLGLQSKDISLPNGWFLEKNVLHCLVGDRYSYIIDGCDYGKVNGYKSLDQQKDDVIAYLQEEDYSKAEALKFIDTLRTLESNPTELDFVNSRELFNRQHELEKSVLRIFDEAIKRVTEGSELQRKK